MSSLFLNDTEIKKMHDAIESMENDYGNKYSYQPESSVFSCSCSGPQQSCIWH